MRSLLIALLLLAPSCGNKDEPAPFDPTKLAGGAPADPTVEVGGTFIWGRSGDAIRLDPALVTDGESVQVVTNVFDTLVSFKPGTTEIVPWLATEWATTKGGLVWTFQLRDDVKFHDGSAFDAEAVVFSFERQRDKTHPARRDEDVFSYYESNFRALEKVEATAPHTVRFTLRQPYAPFLSALALFSCSIVSPAAFASEGKGENGRYRYNFAQKPVGTGPFVFESWQKDAQIVLERNAEHFAGPPPLERLIFKVIKNAQARLKELEGGGIHGMDNPEPVDLPSAHENDDLQVLSRPGINVCYLAMNTEKRPFDDKRVRQAVAFAIDKQRIIDAAYHGVAEAAVSMCPSSLRGHNPIIDRKPNPRRGTELMKEAGVGPGLEVTLWYPVIQRTYLPDSGAVAIQIKEQLGQVGIEVTLKRVEWASFLKGTANGEHDLCLLGWMADIGDPDNFLYVLLDKDNAKKPAENRSFYRGARVHKLLLEAQRSIDWTHREQLYHEVQRILHDEVPTVPLVTAPDFRIVRKNVRGYTIYPAGGEYFRHVSFTK